MLNAFACDIGSIRAQENIGVHSELPCSGRIERTDGDEISIRISERKLHSSSVWIHMWLFFQPADERARPWQGHLKVVDPEEQQEAVARLGVVGTCQRGMLVGTPLVETKQDRSIRVDDLREVLVGRNHLR